MKYESTDKQTIDLVRGDDFLRSQKLSSVDLLKIDVEGAEYDAILGFEEHLEKGEIKMIQFEYGIYQYFNKKTAPRLL